MSFAIIHLHGASVHFSSSINLLIAGKIVPSLANRTILDPEQSNWLTAVPFGTCKNRKLHCESWKSKSFLEKPPTKQLKIHCRKYIFTRRWNISNTIYIRISRFRTTKGPPKKFTLWKQYWIDREDQMNTGEASILSCIYCQQDFQEQTDN